MAGEVFIVAAGEGGLGMRIVSEFISLSQLATFGGTGSAANIEFSSAGVNSSVL